MAVIISEMISNGLNQGTSRAKVVPKPAVIKSGAIKHKGHNTPSTTAKIAGIPVKSSLFFIAIYLAPFYNPHNL